MVSEHPLRPVASPSCRQIINLWLIWSWIVRNYIFWYPLAYWVIRPYGKVLPRRELHESKPVCCQNVRQHRWNKRYTNKVFSQRSPRHNVKKRCWYKPKKCVIDCFTFFPLQLWHPGPRNSIDRRLRKQSTPKIWSSCNVAPSLLWFFPPCKTGERTGSLSLPTI